MLRSRIHYRRCLTLRALVISVIAGWTILAAPSVFAARVVDVDTRTKTLFDLVNAYRVQNDLAQVKASVGLTTVANWMAQDMAANNYMDHTDSLGRDPFARMDALGYAEQTWRGENLAAGPMDPETTMDLWKNSPGHNANLLRAEFTVMGLGRVYGPNTTFGWYWAQEFGGILEEEALLNPVNQRPSGFLDGADCARSWGWARDMDTTPPVRVRAYRDGPVGAGGVFTEEFTAGELRSDLGMNVGFSWAIPDFLKDGSSHALYLYATDSDGGPNALLSGSPKTIQCSPAAASTAKPDLVVQSVDLEPGNPALGLSVTFKGVITNTGPGSAGSFFASLRFDVGNNGTWDILPGQLAIDALSGNALASFTVRWLDFWTAASGTHKVEVCADAGAAVVESNESNNCAFKTFSIGGSAVPPPSPPPSAEPVTDISLIPEGAIIRTAGDIDVYIVKYVGSPSTSSGQAKKFKRLILSPSVFNNYGHLRWEDIIEVSVEVRDAFVTSNLVRAAGDPRVYALFPSGDTGSKRWIPTAETFNANGFDWDAIYEINFFDRDSYVTGPDFT